MATEDVAAGEKGRGGAVALTGAVFLALAPLFHFINFHRDDKAFVHEVHALNALVVVLALAAFVFAILARRSGDFFYPRLAGICAFVILFFGLLKSTGDPRFGLLVGGIGAGLLVGSAPLVRRSPS